MFQVDFQVQVSSQILLHYYTQMHKKPTQRYYYQSWADTSLLLHSPSRNHRQGNHHLAAFEIESNETADYSTRDSRIPAPRCNVNKPGNLQLSHFASDSEFLHWRAKEQLVDKNISTMTLHELRRRRRQILMSILLHQSHSPQYSNIHK